MPQIWTGPRLEHKIYCMCHDIISLRQRGLAHEENNQIKLVTGWFLVELWREQPEADVPWKTIGSVLLGTWSWKQIRTKETAESREIYWQSWALDPPSQSIPTNQKCERCLWKKCWSKYDLLWDIKVSAPGNPHLKVVGVKWKETFGFRIN
jgi:hypothetical protein